MSVTISPTVVEQHPVLKLIPPEYQERVARALLDEMEQRRAFEKAQIDYQRERDLFTAACAAMTGLLHHEPNGGGFEYYAAESVSFAEALIDEIEKRRKT